jgi:hypothetical protein
LNPRIRNLAETWATQRVEINDKTIYTFSESALNVFAKKLISECTDVVHASATARKIDSTHHARAILEHFSESNK